jgi:hypothetical protein
MLMGCTASTTFYTQTTRQVGLGVRAAHVKHDPPESISNNPLPHCIHPLPAPLMSEFRAAYARLARGFAGVPLGGMPALHSVC